MIEKSLVGSKKLNSNILGSSLYKAITIVANLLLVRACVDYMGEEKYGIWLTLLSFFTWFSVLEVGISNSFRNKLTNYFTDQDTINGRIVVTNTYKLIGIVYIALSLFLVCLIILFPLDHFFLPSNFIAQDFTFAFGLSTILFMLYYIAYALNTVLLSTHFAKLTYIISAAQSIVTLLGIYIFMYSGIKPSFIIIFGWFSGIPLLVWTIANIAIYRKTLIAYRPNFSRVFSKKVFPLQKMNGGFFIIQFCILIIFSTDNFIIINKLTGTEVLKYNVAFKYFNILIVVFNLILLP